MYAIRSYYVTRFFVPAHGGLGLIPGLLGSIEVSRLFIGLFSLALIGLLLLLALSRLGLILRLIASRLFLLGIGLTLTGFLLLLLFAAGSLLVLLFCLALLGFLGLLVSYNFV